MGQPVECLYSLHEINMRQLSLPNKQSFVRHLDVTSVSIELMWEWPVTTQLYGGHRHWGDGGVVHTLGSGRGKMRSILFASF